jgi:hypothetical protein
LNHSEVKLYPNPVAKTLNIMASNRIQLVEIYNIQGQKVITSTQTQIEVDHLPSGMYTAKIVSNDNSITIKKVIVE